MKQSIVVVLALFMTFIAVQVNAQIQYNPKVGVNVSALDAKLQDISAEARVGWNAGVDFRFGESMFFFYPGVHYHSMSARLFKDIEGTDEVSLKDETTIQSVRVPLNLGVRLTGEGGLLGIHAKGGITPSYVLGVKEKEGSINFSKDNLTNLTWSANVGVGVDIWFLTADLSYDVGLTNFFNDADGKNYMVTLSVGVKF